MKAYLYLLFFIALVSTLGSHAQIITPYAGDGTSGFFGDEGQATAARFKTISTLGVDAQGNIFVSDQENNRVRRIDHITGEIKTIAGTGLNAYNGDNLPATTANLFQQWGIVSDGAGNVYIADQGHNVVRRLTAATGILKNVAGDTTYGYSGDGGLATNASIQPVLGIAINSSGDIFITQQGSFVIRKVTAATGIIAQYAGNFTSGGLGDGGLATNAQIGKVNGMVCDAAGNLFFCDQTNNKIRKVTPGGTISTVAGNGTAGSAADGVLATTAPLNYPIGIAINSAGELFVSEFNNHCVRKISTTGIITRVAGTGSPGYSGDEGPAISAQLYQPIGLAVDLNDNLFIADAGNYRVRRVVRSLAFVHGRSQFMQICKNSGAVSINEQLTVKDYVVGLTETWSMLSPPLHGVAITSYSTVGGSGNTSPVGLTYTPATGYVGLDSFKVRISNGSATEFTTIHIQVNPPAITPSPIMGDSMVCEGATISLTDTATTGTWSISNGHANLTASANLALVQGVSFGRDTIIYTVTNTCGTLSVSRIITVNPTPNAGTISGPTSLCVGTTITLHETASGGIWSVGSGTASISGVGIVTGISGGENIVNYTVANAWCMGVAIYHITIDTFPNPGAISGPSGVCTGSTIYLTDTITGGTWSSQDATVSLSGGSVTGLASGTAIISYSISNSCGTAVATFPLTVNILPGQPSVTEQQGWLVASPGYTTYQWYANGIVIPGATDDTCLATTPGIYEVRVTNDYGCVQSSVAVDYPGCLPEHIMVFPNPARTEVNVMWCRKMKGRLTCPDGKELRLINELEKLDVSLLSAGLYLLVIYDEHGNKVATQKITKL